MERARRWLRGAEVALSDGRWDDVVYAAQMAVEQSAKAVLFALGVDFPREHDVSEVFVALSERGDLPADFREAVPRMCVAIRELAEQRGLAGYGFEQGIDAEYFKAYAPEALQMALEVHSACEGILNTIFEQKT